MELHLGMEPTESLWLRIKGRAGTGDIIVRVCYRPPNQEDQTDEALCRQIGAASCSQDLVLLGNFSHRDTCWRDDTAGHKQSRRFLEYIDDNFLLQDVLLTPNPILFEIARSYGMPVPCFGYPVLLQ